jgi:hypothetical protein
MDFFLTGNEKDFFNLYNHRIDRTLILKPAEFLYGPAKSSNFLRGQFFIIERAQRRVVHSNG